jgi:hypothetical protein
MRASLMGPVMSSLPVRHTPGSAGVEGHSSFLSKEREIFDWAGVARCNCSMSRQPATCFSPWSAQRLPASCGQRGSGEHYLGRAVRWITTDKPACGFTTSTVPATGPRGARATLALPAQRLVTLRCRGLRNCLKEHGRILCAAEPSGHTPEAAQRFAPRAQRG